MQHRPPSPATTKTFPPSPLPQVISGVGVLQAANVKAPSPIGTCQQFCTRRVGDQTFMCLKGCLPSRGCTLVLRGAPLPVLKCLKNLLSFAVFTAHRSAALPRRVLSPGRSSSRSSKRLALLGPESMFFPLSKYNSNLMDCTFFGWY